MAAADEEGIIRERLVTLLCGRMYSYRMVCYYVIMDVTLINQHWGQVPNLAVRLLQMGLLILLCVRHVRKLYS